MKEYYYGIIISFSFLSMLLAGCASTALNNKNTDNKAAEGQNEDAEKIDNVRVSEFILGVGDTIEVAVYTHDDLKKTIKIDSSGKIMVPLIGDVQANGISIFKLRDVLKERLSAYVVDPQITVSVSTIQSQKIMVLGEVKNPGIFALDVDLSVMDAVSKAGGATEDAKINNVVLIRRNQGKTKVTSLDLRKVFKEGDFSQCEVLQNGDIVYIPAITIAKISRFASHLSQIIRPLVDLETGVVLWPDAKDVLSGKDTSSGGGRLAIPAGGQ